MTNKQLSKQFGQILKEEVLKLILEEDTSTVPEHFTKNPYHKIITKHKYEHIGSKKKQFSTYKQNIDQHTYKHSNGNTIQVSINHDKRDDSHPAKMWSHSTGEHTGMSDYDDNKVGIKKVRGRSGSDLDKFLINHSK